MHTKAAVSEELDVWLKCSVNVSNIKFFITKVEIEFYRLCHSIFHQLDVFLPVCQLFLLQKFQSTQQVVVRAVENLRE